MRGTQRKSNQGRERGEMRKTESKAKRERVREKEKIREKRIEDITERGSGRARNKKG